MARILVFDEDKNIREWLSLELAEQSYEVVTAASWHQLINRRETSEADLIILDIRILDCYGLERLREIRESRADLPVIMWTACDFYTFENRAIAADYHVVKSYDLTELKSSIQSALEANSSPMASRINPTLPVRGGQNNENTYVHMWGTEPSEKPLRGS
jgi:DNA-binding response OmpR family regulator